tara:strand:- start:1515 stop:2465 length:951 start_codon:yes stop_codon:yes gene_type:complete
MTLFYEFDLDENGELRRTIDIAESVSLVARKAYRQGCEWAIAGIRFESSQGFNVELSTLPQTWVTAQTWKTAFRAWRKMQRLAIQATESDEVAAKYQDFKVGYDKYHLNSALTGYAPNLIPRGYSTPGGAVATREWQFSEFDFPQDSELPGSSRLLHMVGDDDGATNGSIGLIHNYANLRARPQSADPNIPEGGVESAFNWLFDYGGDNEPTIADFIGQNNAAPYINGVDPTEEEYYPGGKNICGDAYSWMIASTNIYHSGAGGGSNGFIPGFTAYCGLIRLNCIGQANTQNIKMFIDLMPGPHDGYMARPMQEVN